MTTFAVALPQEVFRESGINQIFYNEYNQSFIVHSFKGDRKIFTREQLKYNVKYTHNPTLQKQTQYLLDWCTQYYNTALDKSPVVPRRSQLLLLTH